MIDYSIVTATYNESENISDLVRSIAKVLRPSGKQFEIVVVDDNSPDGTGRVVEGLVHTFPEVRLITRTSERGIGTAYLRGIQESRGRIVATMDADFSHPPDALPKMLRVAETGALVLGSRFLHRGDFETLWYRYVPTRSINLWHRLLLQTKVNDHTNGFLAIDSVTMQMLLLKANQLGLRPFDRILYGLVLVAIAKRMTIPVKEERARYVFRTRGETKIHFFRGIALLLEEWLDSLRLLPVRYGAEEVRPQASESLPG
jgi:dolichol-phosphate mannosyltransferase